MEEDVLAAMKMANDTFVIMGRSHDNGISDDEFDRMVQTCMLLRELRAISDDVMALVTMGMNSR